MPTVILVGAAVVQLTAAIALFGAEVVTATGAAVVGVIALFMLNWARLACRAAEVSTKRLCCSRGLAASLATQEAGPMLHVSLLGEQVVTDDVTGVVRLRSSHTVALVAFLVVHAGSPQVRQHIAAAFWPDSTGTQALTNLRRELHHLRHVLGDDESLVVTAKDLCWRDTDTCRVDVRAFDLEHRAAVDAAGAGDTERVLRHGGSALARYRGELLPGVFADWLLEARSDLQRRCVELCDLLAAARARSGDLPGAVDAARRRIRLEPWEEVGYRSLMELQSELGDRAGAVSTYHHCASVLERELGVEPDRATRATLHRVLARGRPAAAPARVAPAPDRSGFAAAQLVGRSRELGILHSVWRSASAGRPCLAVVRGDAGVGKTRLVAEIAELARADGAVVATTLCFGTSGRLALAPVADWLRNPAMQPGIAALDPVWRAEVDRLVPSGPGPGEPATGSRAMVDAWQRHRFFEGLARALTGVGRRTLLVLDNLQWCDEETLAFLTFCLGLRADSPLLVAGTLRTHTVEDEAVLVAWTERMRATGMLTEVTLGPLDAPGTARLAAAVAGRPLRRQDTDLLQATTGGFPLHVVEATRTLVDGGGSPRPATDLTTVLRDRLDQVTPAAREVAGLAAAVGRDFTLDLLSEASDLDADAVVRAVDELWRRRILHEFGDGYDFSHDLLRDAAYAQVSRPRRWLVHRRVAQGLELLHADDTDAVSAQLAEQYARGGRGERALAYYRRAAEVAAAMFAHAEAIRLHTEALEIVRSLPEGRARDRHELAVLEAMAAPLTARYGYASPRLQRVLERSVELGEVLGRRDSTCAALVSLWSSRFVQGRIADGHRTARRALDMVEPDSPLSAPAHFAVAGSAVTLGRPAEALRQFALSAALTGGAHSMSVGTRPDVHGRAWAAHAHWLLGHGEEALASCRDAVALARRVDHPYSLAVALAYAGITHQIRGDLPELRDAVGELRELCDRHGFAYYREWGLILAGWADADVDLARRGIDHLRSEGAFARMPYWLSLLGDLSARTGAPGHAVATLDAALVAARARDDVWWLPEVMRMRAAHNDPTQAVDRLHSAARTARDHGSVALLRRCEHDLAARGVRSVRTGP
ncbi:MAG TPA: AAA family ATPase [Pseudonocardia sp.]|nr:AAA family ATPase [Pseudonocardia sp.]